MQQYLTPKEAAARLRVHPHTVYRYIRRGLLRANRTCPRGPFRITEQAIEEFLAPSEADAR